MFQSILLLVFAFVSIQCNNTDTLFNFSLRELNKTSEVSLSQYQGKCVIVINTASGCGFTNGNMEFLNKLQEQYDSKDFAIIAIPSNYYNQEHKTEDELVKWFRDTWKAKYDVYGLIDIGTSDLYKFLTKIAGDRSPKWNYTKYIVDKNGKSATRFTAEAGTLFDRGITEHIAKCVG